jgi:hypothetical protein
MTHCQNCGQVNTQAGNFCRFCGTKFTAMQYSNKNNYNPLPNPAPSLQSNYENSPPPRPYSWKTDEYQIPEDKTPKSKPFDRVPPLPNFQTQQNMAMQSFQPAPVMSPNFHCPRCSSQNFPLITRQISTGGWIVFAVLLVTFFPLFWIGLLIKEEVQICPVCKFKYQ